MPIAALAGKREVMEHLAPTGPVYQAGTLSGNPLSVASGITTLKLADDALYRMLDTRSEQLQTALTQALTDAGGWIIQFRRRQPVLGCLWYRRARRAQLRRY